MRRALRQTGDEAVEDRARRLAEVALRGWFAAHDQAPDPIETWVAGFLACADDLCLLDAPAPGQLDLFTGTGGAP